MSFENVRPVRDERKPALFTDDEIGDMLGSTDGQLGQFLTTGGETNRRGAIDDALLDAHALCDVLSAIDNTAIEEATQPGSLCRLAMMAQAKIERVQALRDINLKPQAEGGGDE